jgi:ribosomal protein L32
MPQLLIHPDDINLLVEDISTLNKTEKTGYMFMPHHQNVRKYHNVKKLINALKICQSSNI